jgi:hypothetical protein
MSRSRARTWEGLGGRNLVRFKSASFDEVAHCYHQTVLPKLTSTNNASELFAVPEGEEDAAKYHGSNMPLFVTYEGVV